MRKKIDPVVDEAIETLNMKDGPSRRRLLEGAGLFSATAAASALIAACSSSSSSSAAPSGSAAAVAGNFPTTPKWKFTFVNHVTDNAFFTPTQYGMADCAALLGLPTPAWTGALSTQPTNSTMLSALQAAITAGSPGIATTVVSATAFVAPINSALQAGIPVVTYNANGASEPASIHVQWRGPGTDPKLSLYVLAIGISDYKDKNVRLKFAAKDAADFVALAKKQEGGLYEKVIPYSPRGSLQDADATREAILDGLDWISRTVGDTNDVAMIFLAGHGITTPDLHYRFLPYDYDANRIPRTTITDSEFEDYLTKIGGKKIFFFDTCYSGNVLKGRAPSTAPDVDRFANQLRAAENGIVVFTSSTGNELSQELEQYKNGAFTLAVVEGMRGAAARPQTPVIMISDLQGYVSRRVRDLTKGNQKPMVAMPKTVEDYPISIRLQ